ncbi:NAD(P)H-dependent FMN reductase [Andreprevotia sp. IGB-42]|uniref:NADPH-dependent FMN reductase n=1 Tax=Andreprevotia sp. IGB-42 TaxID=2497473 RepID=UPI00135A6745|nr:NAD(P)H-dependent oxidoreductase [Andreprevotia sp. IGB-42]KAF0811852.1 NAD(P)H-dependent FMN reductase [Andreprevotia sp. IGB-42]
MTIKLLAFSASTRLASYNRKLIAVAAQAARDAGAEVTLIDLLDYDMPLYNGDLEARDGLPASTQALQQLFAGHDGLLLSTPEYNGLFPPLLKNTLDWVSRGNGLDHLAGKVAGILSASPGRVGGLRSLMATRQYLNNLGLLVVPQQQAVSEAGHAFDEQGLLLDARVQAGVNNVAVALVGTTQKLRD